MPETIDFHKGRWGVRGDLLVAAAATTNGVWRLVEGQYPLIVTCSGTLPAGTSAVDLHATNQAARPSDDDNTHPVMKIFTGVDYFVLNGPLWWIKMRVRTLPSGIVSAAYAAFGAPQ